MWTDPDDTRTVEEAPASPVAPTESRVPPPRPAILLGYGDFGHTLLRRFLTSAALRGALEWESPPGGASPAERFLRDLAPIWVKDHLAPSGKVPGGLEVMSDLVGQIRPVPASDSQPEALAAAVEEAVGRVLAAPVQHRRKGPLGLDVFVLAQPGSARTMGRLEQLVAPLMARLENHTFLRTARRTSYVAVFDFENYWDHSGDGRKLRAALRKAVERWQRRRTAKRPAFDRFYLVDGRAEGGERKEAERIDELILFLELALFEGQRGELQRLYQTHTDSESPVYSFGVRVMERRSALLSRRAAAKFGRDWLGYLAGDGSRDEVAEALRRSLQPYRPGALERAFAVDELRGDLDRTLKELEAELVEALAGPGSDWIETVKRRYREVAEALEDRLRAQAGRRMDELVRDRLSGLEGELQRAVETDLHFREHPVPLGVVLREVDDTLAELAALEPAPRESPAGIEELSDRLETTSWHYRRFHSERLHERKLHYWWPLFAVSVAAGMTPLLSDLLQDVPRPGALAPRLATLGWGALQWLADPIATSLLVLGLTWGIGALWVHRRFRRRLERSERVFHDPLQGKLADRLRQALGPGGSLRAPLEELLDRLVQDLVLAVGSTVQRELDRIRERLVERRREMGWLRRQLESFGRVHGGSGDGPNRSEIRLGVEGPEEYDRMLARNAPNEARFRSEQRELQPFQGWNQPWCDAFLYPLSFIERLSAIYHDPIERELSRPGEGPEQERWASAFAGFVERHGSSPIAFHWTRREGLPPEERFCLLPPLWRRLPNVRNALVDIAIDEQHLLPSRDVARSYLLRIQGGVDPSCLVTADAAAAGVAGGEPAEAPARGPKEEP